MESRDPRDPETPWAIEDTEHGFDAEARIRERLARKNGDKTTGFFTDTNIYKVTRYVPEAHP